MLLHVLKPILLRPLLVIVLKLAPQISAWLAFHSMALFHALFARLNLHGYAPRPFLGAVPHLIHVLCTDSSSPRLRPTCTTLGRSSSRRTRHALLPIVVVALLSFRPAPLLLLLPP